MAGLFLSMAVCQALRPKTLILVILKIGQDQLQRLLLNNNIKINFKPRMLAKKYIRGQAGNILNTD